MTQQTQSAVVGLGELLWDCFPDGRRPGGAPANFAFHARQLGLRGEVCSRVGADADGDALVDYVAQRGLSPQNIQRDGEHPTGRVEVELDENNQPRYTIVENVAWDHLTFDEQTQQLMAGAAAVCFGTLAQRTAASRETIHRCLATAGAGCRIVYDVNLRPPWYERATIERSLQAADVLKLNDEEVVVVAGLLELGSDEPRGFAQRIAERFGIDLVCITRGAEGCLLAAGGEVVEQPGVRVQVADPVGAGDTFTAGMVYARLNGWPLEATAALANEAAARVAARAGAMPDLRDEYADLVARLAP